MSSLTGKLCTLVAKIHLLFLVTPAYATLFEQFTLFVTTPLAIFRGKIIQHLLESSVFAENRVIQKRLESFGIDVEITQFLSKFHAVLTYFSVHVCKTRFATQAAGGYRLFDLLISHDVSPSHEIGYSTGLPCLVVCAGAVCLIVAIAAGKEKWHNRHDSR
jgi:hypothetical protein